VRCAKLHVQDWGGFRASTYQSEALPASPCPTRLPAWDRYSPCGLASARLADAICVALGIEVGINTQTGLDGSTYHWQIVVVGQTKKPTHRTTPGPYLPLRRSLHLRESVLDAQATNSMLCKPQPCIAPIFPCRRSLVDSWYSFSFA
jgi:hypothetical protein